MIHTTNIPTLSVVISSYNYCQHLSCAIDSVLEQSSPAELIVVDDCSTDESPSVIKSYGGQLKSVLLEKNRGQGACFNIGADHAKGDLIMFLDADDFLLPGAVQMIRENASPDVAIYHYRMRYSTEEGSLYGVHPRSTIPLAAGDLVKQLCHVGRYFGTVTSGLVFDKSALTQVLPVAEEAFRWSADGYLCVTVPFYGSSASFETPVSAYRIRGAPIGQFGDQVAKRARYNISHDHHRIRHLRIHAARSGLQVRDNVVDYDIEHVQDRLVSLLIEPELHPVKTDDVKHLIGLIRTALKDPNMQMQAPGKLTQWFWAVVARLPRSIQKRLVVWKLNPASRPIWLSNTGQFLRARLGIALR